MVEICNHFVKYVIRTENTNTQNYRIISSGATYIQSS